MYTYHIGPTRYICNRSQFERAGFFLTLLSFQNIIYIQKEKTMNSEIKELLNKAKTGLANGLMIGTAVGSIIGGVVFHDTESMILGVLSLILLELFNLNDKLDKR